MFGKGSRYGILLMLFHFSVPAHRILQYTYDFIYLNHRFKLSEYLLLFSNDKFRISPKTEKTQGIIVGRFIIIIVLLVWERAAVLKNVGITDEIPWN